MNTPPEQLPPAQFVIRDHITIQPVGDVSLTGEVVISNQSGVLFRISDAKTCLELTPKAIAELSQIIGLLRRIAAEKTL